MDQYNIMLAIFKWSGSTVKQYQPHLACSKYSLGINKTIINFNNEVHQDHGYHAWSSTECARVSCQVISGPRYGSLWHTINKRTSLIPRTKPKASLHNWSWPLYMVFHWLRKYVLSGRQWTHANHDACLAWPTITWIYRPPKQNLQ